MYIRLTSRCNMRCDHCGFACTSRGEDMDFDVLTEILRRADNYGCSVTLGGGEPTIYKHFDKLLDNIENDLVLHRSEVLYYVITNGTRKRRCMRMISLMNAYGEDGRFGVALSDGDGFHDSSKVDPDVRRAFYAFERNGHHYAINNVTNIAPVGRAAGQHWAKSLRCFCDDIVIYPDGSVHACGCPDAEVLGKIWDLPDDVINLPPECSKSDEKSVALLNFKAQQLEEVTA